MSPMGFRKKGDILIYILEIILQNTNKMQFYKG